MMRIMPKMIASPRQSRTSEATPFRTSRPRMAASSMVSGRALERVPRRLSRIRRGRRQERALDSMLVAFPCGKPVSTFPGNAPARTAPGEGPVAGHAGPAGAGCPEPLPVSCSNLDDVLLIFVRALDEVADTGRVERLLLVIGLEHRPPLVLDLRKIGIADRMMR